MDNFEPIVVPNNMAKIRLFERTERNLLRLIAATTFVVDPREPEVNSELINSFFEFTFPIYVDEAQASSIEEITKISAWINEQSGDECHYDHCTRVATGYTYCLRHKDICVEAKCSNRIYDDEFFCESHSDVCEVSGCYERSGGGKCQACIQQMLPNVCIENQCESSILENEAWCQFHSYECGSELCRSRVSELDTVCDSCAKLSALREKLND